MSNAELSSVIADIYDAAIDPTLWQYALSRISDFVGGISGVLFWHDANGIHPNNLLLYKDHPRFTSLYFEKYQPMDPLFPAASFSDEGTVHSIADFVPPQELLLSRFYKEWMQPQGIGDAVVVTLEKGLVRSAFVVVCMSTPAGTNNDDARHRLNILVPHLQRAVAIGRLFDVDRAENATFTETLNAIRAAVVLVKADSSITFANFQAKTLLDEAVIIRDVHGRLQALAPEANRRLKEMLSFIGRSDSAAGFNELAIHLSDEEAWFAHVLPLTAGRRRDVGASRAVAAIFIGKNAPNALPPLEILARNYKLTPGEARVLEAVLKFDGVDGIADALDLSQSTVKTHLQKIFQKTGVRSQRELVKLAAQI